MSDIPCPPRADISVTAHPALGRRTVLRSAAALGGAAFVVGCGGNSDTPAATGGTSSTPSSTSSSGGGGGGEVLGPVADIPVGGGAISGEIATRTNT